MAELGPAGTTAPTDGADGIGAVTADAADGNAELRAPTRTPAAEAGVGANGVANGGAVDAHRPAAHAPPLLVCGEVTDHIPVAAVARNHTAPTGDVSDGAASTMLLNVRSQRFVLSWFS